MEIKDTFIDGLKIIKLNKFTDFRGSFLKVFNFDFFKDNHLKTDFMESYFSVSDKNVIRGMHFQLPPFENDKIVFLNHGKIMDVVLDIRVKSKTFGRFFNIEISENDPILVYIPIGCAHGFMSMTSNSIVSYFQTSVYNKDSDSGVKWDSFGMKWGIIDPIISEKDAMLLDFNHFISPF
jgi:dTDP-4-dehydrorhamnose 3,5-epimerase